MDSLEIINTRKGLFKFIQPEDVIVNCGVAANINTDNFQIPIQTATNLKIKPTLGDTLFEKLKTAYISANYSKDNLPDSTTSVDGIDYKELYNQIYLPLCWWSFIESLIGISIKVGEKGLLYNNSDYGENGELAAYNQLNNRQQKIAQYYIEELQKYICNTFKNDADVTTENVKSGGFSSGVYFGNYKKTEK